MAVRLTTPADYPRMVQTWNDSVTFTGAAVWTERDLTRRMEDSLGHIDDIAGSWVITTPDPDGGREIYAYPLPLESWPELMFAHAAAFPPATVTYCYVGPLASNRLRNYLRRLYTRQTLEGGWERFSATMGEVVAKARTRTP